MKNQPWSKLMVINVEELPLSLAFSLRTLIVSKLREWVNTLLFWNKLPKKAPTFIPPTNIFGKNIKPTISYTIVLSQNRTLTKWKGEGKSHVTTLKFRNSLKVTC